MNGSSLSLPRSFREIVAERFRSSLSKTQAASASDLIRMVGETYATQVLRVGLGLAATVLVARILGPQGRGLYAAALAIGALGVQFGNFGLGCSNTYYVAKDRRLLSVLAGNTLLVSFLVGGVGAAGAWAVFSLWPKLAPVHGVLLGLSLLIIPFGLAYTLLQGLLLGVLDVRNYNKIELDNKVLAVALVALFWATKIATVETMLFGALLTQIVAFVWIFRRIGTLAAPARPETSLTLLREHVGVSSRAYLVLLFSFLVVRVDLLMVLYMLGPERAGQYSIAAGMADYLIMLPVTAGTILFPKFSAMRDISEKFQLTKKAALLIGLVMLPTVAAVALLAKPLVLLLFGEAYLPAAEAFIWLMPGTLFLGVECVAVQFLNSLGYPRSVPIVWFVCLLINIVLNLWVIRAFGIVGASVNSSLTYVLASLLIFWIIAKNGRQASAGAQASV